VQQVTITEIDRTDDFKNHYACREPRHAHKGTPRRVALFSKMVMVLDIFRPSQAE
jgi:hypothetical protein